MPVSSEDPALAGRPRRTTLEQAVDLVAYEISDVISELQGYGYARADRALLVLAHVKQAIHPPCSERQPKHELICRNCFVKASHAE